jgi:hypothetical protein
MEATEVTVAGGPTLIVWGLSYDGLNYLRGKHYPRAVSAEPIVDLSDHVEDDDDAGPIYPGRYGL